MMRSSTYGSVVRAGDARGAIKRADGAILLGFSREDFLIFPWEGVARRASPARTRIAGCWRAFFGPVRQGFALIRS
jgi:hypothetical protein